jgi:acyl-coenzyme A synthetase/AMP-(fatty) acid ligase/aryl carrier-like protein
VVNVLTHLAREPGLQAGDRLLAVTTISFDIAVVELLLPLCVGATVAIARREEVIDGFRLMERLYTEKVTAMQATPSTWRLLLEAGFKAPSGFKILCGGEALPLDLAERLLQGEGELWNMYGPTEATIWASCQPITRTDQPISVGRPMANTRFYILDRYGQQVPIGRDGELYIGGEGLARGYHDRPDLTAERFIANPFGEGRLYRTGDLARYLPGGEVEILGRIDQQIKLRGFRIEPGEIEHALTRHLGLAAAVVALRQDAPSGPQLVAYYVEHQDRNESYGALRSRLGHFLPDYMIPTAWMRLDRLPLLPNGKLDHASLPRPDAVVPVRGDDDQVPVPQSVAEIALAKIWAEVLGLDRVSIDDDVLDLGADSIQIFKITARANRKGLRFTAKQLMTHRTVRAVARAAEQAADAAVIDVSSFRSPLRPAPVNYTLSVARTGRHPAMPGS